MVGGGEKNISKFNHWTNAKINKDYANLHITFTIKSTSKYETKRLIKRETNFFFFKKKTTPWLITCNNSKKGHLFRLIVNIKLIRWREHAEAPYIELCAEKYLKRPYDFANPVKKIELLCWEGRKMIEYFVQKWTQWWFSFFLNEGFADAGRSNDDERGKEKIGFLQLQITGQAIILLR